MKNGLIWFALFLLVGCQVATEPIDEHVEKTDTTLSGVQLVVLGTVQDGGAPHIGCVKSCCAKRWLQANDSLKVVSLGVIDYEQDEVYVFEATPDFGEQVAMVNRKAGRKNSKMPDGIFITHAHIGHYTGLMFLGREAKGAKNVPVYVMPKMQDFLSSNGPWDQLVALENIQLHALQQDTAHRISENISVLSVQVPHRDEYSETVGFIIQGKKKKVLFIPDIDKWSKWEEDIIQMIAQVDVAYLDATFFDAKEINNRDIAEIPHPFVIESMDLFKNLPQQEKDKIYFIHLNHTNPLLDKKSGAYQEVERNGFHVAEFGSMLEI
ncbi:MAG: MBL fold metallo-hydrolase [Saprospiraceae bacterium]|nr:MBL fold metallo-hydrolase [Saprospiraceae bacterium]